MMDGEKKLPKEEDKEPEEWDIRKQLLEELKMDSELIHSQNKKSEKQNDSDQKISIYFSILCIFTFGLESD